MTEDQIKKGSTLLFQKKEAEGYLALLNRPKTRETGLTMYLDPFDDDIKDRWIQMNRDFFAGEVERLRQELESL